MEGWYVLVKKNERILVPEHNLIDYRGKGWTTYAAVVITEKEWDELRDSSYQAGYADGVAFAKEKSDESN